MIFSTKISPSRVIPKLSTILSPFHQHSKYNLFYDKTALPLDLTGFII